MLQGLFAAPTARRQAPWKPLMARRTPLILAGLALAGLAGCGGEPQASEKRGLHLDSLYSFLGEGEQASFGQRFDSLANAVQSAYDKDDSDEFLAATMIQLDWTSRVPIFFLEAHFDEFNQRLDDHGIAPYLSLTIDLGRRLAPLGTVKSLDRYDQLIERFSSTDLQPTGRTVLLRTKRPLAVADSTEKRLPDSDSHYRAYSDNVGIAVASLLFSDFGRIANALGGYIDLDTYLATATEVASCSDCAQEKQAGEGPFAFSRTGFSAGGGAGNFSKTPGEPLGGVGVCQVLNYALTSSMSETGATNLESSTCDTKQSGIQTSKPSSLRACAAKLSSALGQKSAMKEMEKLEGYVSCKMREQAFGELSSGGAVAGALGALSALFCPLWICWDQEPVDKDNDGTPDGKVTKVWDNAHHNFMYQKEEDWDTKNTTKTVYQERQGVEHTIVTIKDGSGEVLSKTDTKEYDNGTTTTTTYTLEDNGDNVTIQTVKGKDGKTYVKTTKNKGQANEETTYGVEGDGKSEPITKEEYEKAKKDNEPPETQPDLTNGYGACEQEYLEGGEERLLVDDDLGPLINPDPTAPPADDELTQALEEFASCIHPKAEPPVCHTYMMCADDPNVDQCTCQRYVPIGLVSGQSCETVITCPNDTRQEGCSCVSDEGDVVFPGKPNLGPTFDSILSSDEALEPLREIGRARP